MKPKNLTYLILPFVVLSVWCLPIVHGATQEEKYVYETSLTTGLDLQAYRVRYREYFWDDSTKIDTEGYGFNLGLEWIPFVAAFGKVALSTGIGFSSVQNAKISTSSTATLYIIPLTVGATYRADFIKNQVLVPFVSGGFDFGFSTQTTKTEDSQGGLKTDTGLRTYKGYYYSAGVELCLNSFDALSGRELDARFGINGVYLTGLYFRSQPLSRSERVNLAHDEFRVGLRFEI